LNADGNRADRHPAGRDPASLPPGIGGRDVRSDIRRMSAAVLTNAAPAASTRLLADVNALGGQDDAREPALIRLEEALGRDFADRLVAALSNEAKH
jgi:hypothetical protein